MIKRYFSDSNFKRIKQDFKFLIKFVLNRYGEFDFAIRDNYFNIYYKGNSLVMIKPASNDNYRITIHNKFFKNTKADNFDLFVSKNSDDKTNRVIIVSKKRIHQFLQSKHLRELASNIREVNNGEEINFEQTLITDNLNRDDWIIIDRQVTDNLLKRKRLDLLALQNIEGNKFKFVVFEAKLGNNKELENKVADQLDNYVHHIDLHFDDYKKCYEKHFEQKKELGLFTNPGFSKIDIVKPVEGIIVVGGYSGLAKDKIKKLQDAKPYLKYKIRTFFHEL